MAQARNDHQPAAPPEDRELLRVGEGVYWRGRRYRLRGVDPMSLPARTAELESLHARRRFRVLLAALERDNDRRP